MVIHENFEPLEFTNSFLTWKESDKKFSYEEKVRMISCNIFINVFQLVLRIMIRISTFYEESGSYHFIFILCGELTQ